MGYFLLPARPVDLTGVHARASASRGGAMTLATGVGLVLTKHQPICSHAIHFLEIARVDIAHRWRMWHLLVILSVPHPEPSLSDPARPVIQDRGQWEKGERPGRLASR